MEAAGAVDAVDDVDGGADEAVDDTEGAGAAASPSSVQGSAIGDGRW